MYHAPAQKFMSVYVRRLSVMALIRTSCSRHTFSVAVTSGKRLLVATRNSCPTGDNKNSVECHRLVESENESQLKIIEFSPDGETLLTSTSDKHITLWSTGDWSITTKRDIAKRGTAVQFTPDNKYLLMADKSGDVLRYTLPDLSDTNSLFLGHSSMLLDMVLLQNSSKFVITCDRDEKIRVSHFPNCYNIHTYCLGHTQLVSRLCKVPSHPQLLLSGSGDGSVMLWDWYNGTSLHTQMCYPGSENTDPQTVTGLVCSSSVESPLVVVTSQSHSELLVFRLSVEDRSLTLVSTLPLTAVPWCIEFDWSNRLWVCLHDIDEPLQCYECQSEKFCKVSPNDEPILEALGKWENFSDCVGKEFDWNALRKQEFDNMSDYLAAKEDRIREQHAKKSGQKENEKALRPKPSKIAKEDINCEC